MYCTFKSEAGAEKANSFNRKNEVDYFKIL